MDSTISQSMHVSPKYIEHITLFYSQVTSHVITADGKFLLAAIKAGYLAVFPVKRYLKDIYLMSETLDGDETTATNDDNRTPSKLKPISLIPVANSLSLHLDKQTDRLQYKFVSGGQGTIRGQTWSLASQLEEKWVIKLPSDNTLVNAIALSKDRIFSGCSDNQIYVHDKETQQEFTKLSAHQDYIHCLKYTEDHTPKLYSASEDGSVRVWDLRTPKEPVMLFMPFKKGSLERTQYGKWIGAIDVSPNGEWLLCGGGPKLSMWHIPSQKCFNVIDLPNVPHVAQFLPSDPSSIISAGTGNHVSIWRKTNDSPIVCNVNSQIDNIYSICHHDYDDFGYNLSSFSGDSFKLELCKNYKYIDSELYVS